MENKTLLQYAVGISIGLALSVSLYFGLSTLRDSDHTSKNLKDLPPPLYGEYKSAAVATGAGPCSVIGKRLLERGGSVVDAAIGAMLCVGILDSYSSGIGGGSFMNIYDAATRETVFINSREVAPLDATENMYEGNSARSKTGASSIAVPGEIAGYWEAHQRYGKLPWKDLFEPAIKLASDGFRVNSAVANAIKVKQNLMNPAYNLASIYVHAVNGSRKREGDFVTSPSLANTLRIIAEEGASAFYNGSLTASILADLRDAPGEKSLIKQQDLNQYKVQVKSTINITLGDLILFVPGAPSGGPVVSYILNILKGYQFTPKDINDTNAKVRTYHRIIEAFKFAFAKRTVLGDDRFDEDMSKIVDELIDDHVGEATRLKIVDSSTQAIEYYSPDYSQSTDDFGTSHLSILGPDGSAISMTSTINYSFGSSVRGYRTGIIFNNEMDDFGSPNITNIYGVPPSPANFIKPGKRPLSSMTPAILVDSTKTGKDAVQIITGGSGGTKIITSVALSVMNMLWFGKRVDEAVASKRFHHQLVPDVVQLGKDFDQEEIVEGLKAKNHSTIYFNPPGSAVQAIQIQPSNLIGATCDERKSGYPDGY